MAKILVVLQNAYSTKEIEIYESRWLRQIWAPGGTGWKSHSGKRLLKMLPRGHEIKVINSSSNIGTKSNARYKASPEYIAAYVRDENPDLIVACGRIAQDGVSATGYRHIKVPHPAWRALSTAHVKKIRCAIENAL